MALRLVVQLGFLLFSWMTGQGPVVSKAFNLNGV